MTPAAAALCGALAGMAVGWASRLSLKAALRSSDAVFYSVFVGGIFVRLALLAAAIWQLRRESYTIIVLFIAPMVLAQMFFEVFPIKHGTKRNP